MDYVTSYGINRNEMLYLVLASGVNRKSIFSSVRDTK